MKIGIVDVDGLHYPNLVLMKLSAYHKMKGDSVEFAYFGNFDIIYYSKIFTFSKDVNDIALCGEKIKGGTGYKMFNQLPDNIEHTAPDYSLYNCKHAYGFLTRGCIRKCSFCIVPEKEGTLKPHSDIEEFLGNYKSAILMDNNVLANDWGLSQIEKIIKLGIKVDFNQGLDARIIAQDTEIAKLLSRVKWLAPLRMACDHKSQMESIAKATELLRKYNCTPKRYIVYVLVKDIDDALERVLFLYKLKLDPFAQPYRSFDTNHVDREAKQFARWVNHKVYKTAPWKNYKYRESQHPKIEGLALTAPNRL